MSNIIKSGRIRSRSVLDFSERTYTSQVEIIHENALSEIENKASHAVSILVAQKEEELAQLDRLVQEKLAEAEFKATKMLQEAEEQASQMLQKSKEQEAILLAETSRKQEEILQSAENKGAQIKEAALQEKKQLLESVEGEVVETIITLLGHIVSEEFTQNTKWLKLILRKMLLKEEVNEPTTLLVSSHNMMALEQEKGQLIASLSKLTAIEVNDSLNDTTCVLTTNQGNIEYDINEGLSQVISELRILKDLS